MQKSVQILGILCLAFPEQLYKITNFYLNDVGLRPLTNIYSMCIATLFHVNTLLDLQLWRNFLITLALDNVLLYYN